MGSAYESTHEGTDGNLPQQVMRAVVRAVIALPGVKVNRATYLQKQLQIYCRNNHIDLHAVIEADPLSAGVPIAKIDKLASASIRKNLVIASGISAATGIPGGTALLATIPADLAQYYLNALRCAQELAYVYGWPDLFEGDELQLDDATETKVILLLGAINGIESATSLLRHLTREIGKEQARRLPRQALTKTWYYPTVKEIAKLLGKKINKQGFGQGVGKVIPFVGALTAAGMTSWTFRHMTKDFQKHLKEMALEGPDGDEPPHSILPLGAP